MRTTLLLAALTAAVTCDVSHILNQPANLYGAPASSYGVPQSSVVGLASAAGVQNLPSVSDFNAQYVENQGQVNPTSRLSLPVKEHVSFQNGFSSTISPDLGINVYSTPAPQLQFQSNFGLNNGNLNLGQFDGQVVDSDAAYNSGLFGGLTSTISPLVTSNGLGGLNYIQRQTFDTGAALPLQTEQGTQEVQKHLYFFAAPEEPEEPEARVNIPVPPARKSVKVIFIKAPTYKAPAPIQIPLQAQNQEKTLVYVLVQKPDRNVPIHLQQQELAPPSKPEVFFIKYKSQKEADEAISHVQSIHSKDDDLQINGISQDNIQLLARNGFADLGGQVVSSTISPLAFGNIQSTATPLVTPLAYGVQSTTLSPLAGLNSGNLQSLQFQNAGLGGAGAFGSGNLQTFQVQNAGLGSAGAFGAGIQNLPATFGLEGIQSTTASPITVVESSTMAGPAVEVSNSVETRASLVGTHDNENVIETEQGTSGSVVSTTATPNEDVVVSNAAPADEYGPPK